MLLFWPLVIPFLTMVATLFAWRSIRTQRALSLLGAAALLAVALVILTRVIADGPFAEQAGAWPAPFGITMVADGLSAAMITLTGLVALAAAVFGLQDVSDGEARSGHHPLANALLAGVCGAFLTGDLFNMYVWFEVMLISSFGLLVIGGRKAALDGATKYVGLNLIATVAFISGVGLLYGTTGALNMADLHGRLAGRGGEAGILMATGLIIFAFGAKAALFPLHFWLPASYHTPSFTTSALFAALLTKVGVYALIRYFTLILPIADTPAQPALLWIGGFTILAGALGALAQSGVRRVLNYSIMSSIGAMILGLALATPLALVGAVFYLAQDMIVKANLYLVAGSARRLAGSEDFAEAGGLWRAAPWLAALFLVPALSLAGVPPFSGFWAKLILTRASLEAGGYWCAALILGSGLMTLLAMARIFAEMFWKSHPEGDVAAGGRLPAAAWAPLVALSLLIAGAGIFAAPGVEASEAIARNLLAPDAYLAAVLGPGAEVRP
ncbi:proton-conducting transporter transmembrane domain-containing protein [Amaricoccus solimangrovi]|uniref:Na+/H+ antiporter subunit D n=1 Tax=Amaricoccus solimangrovi TaxID=2589815 RepID=A0A501WRU0_9RHOB|nr:proton-conducting transporter membrane subunit [Amaricoccus solimangrovi]TPE52179.1 Na+/H+ antiporter subunit D [Amaricoccus solimangrovi]